MAFTAGAMNALLLLSGNTFIADTYVNDEPDAEELAEITLMAAETVRRFGIEPRVALLSHSTLVLLTARRRAKCVRRWNWSGNVRQN